MPRLVPIKELDLRIGHASTLADKMNTVPGFRTSAAFFSFLRANLVLPQSTLNSNTSTPLLDPSSSQTLPPLIHSSLATMTSNADEDATLKPNPLDEIPPLTTAALTAEADKTAALKLIADSIAQQRQLASRAVIFHPLTIAVYIGVLAILSRLIYKSNTDIGLLLTTGAGITMTGLVAVRGITRGYVDFAESLNWNWVKNEDGEDDIIVGSRYGEDIIGAAVLRLERYGHGSGKKKTKNSKTGGKGLVRAWTTKMRYRGTGVGTELLEEAVRITRDKLGSSAEIGFAVEHANSKAVLPEIFNGGFRKREMRAAKALETVVESMELSKKKR